MLSNKTAQKINTFYILTSKITKRSLEKHTKQDRIERTDLIWTSVSVYTVNNTNSFYFDFIFIRTVIRMFSL